MGVAFMAVACGGTETVTVVQTTTVTETETVPEQVETSPVPDATETETEAESEEDTSGQTIRQVGGTGIDGGLAFRVTSIREVASVPQDEFTEPNPARPVAGAKFVTATVTVINNGQTGAGPFCGGGDAVLIDDRDRNFEPVGDVQISIPGNNICGDDIQPGFKDTYTLVFQVPKAAKIVGVAVWNSDDEDDFSGDSYVLFRR
jgi:hypothetical protein